MIVSIFGLVSRDNGHYANPWSVLSILTLPLPLYADQNPSPDAVCLEQIHKAAQPPQFDIHFQETALSGTKGPSFERSGTKVPLLKASSLPSTIPPFSISLQPSVRHLPPHPPVLNLTITLGTQSRSTSPYTISLTNPPPQYPQYPSSHVRYTIFLSLGVSLDHPAYAISP